MTPYRMVFSNGRHVIQFHPTVLVAASRAITLRDDYYKARDVFVYVESGFYPQPAGLHEFSHAKEIA